MTPGRDTRQTIVQLLSNVSDGREIHNYLQRFSELEQTRFAVIKIGGAILRDQLDETAASLALLHTVGLTPIVIHGGGPQLDERLGERGLSSDKVDGLRVTTPQVLDVAREVFTEQNIRLVEAIRAQEVEAHGLTQGVFDADLVDSERYGLVGEPTAVHLDLLRSIVKSGAIPILTCLGVAPGGQMVNINADSATKILVHEIQPMKIIFLVDSGGLLDPDGNVIDSINLATDYHALVGEEWVHSGMRLKLEEIKRLLDDAPMTTSVSITSPSALARELFTHSGDGTLVRQGERIEKVTSKDEVDELRLTSLIEAAFDQALAPGWWDQIELLAAYASETYRAAAVVTRLDEFVYLDKFAIDETARGEGLARTVWDHMIRDFPDLVWRSRTDNPFNAFYEKESDGRVITGHWTVYWKGVTDFDVVGRAVKLLSEMEASFLMDDDDD
ncbi:MAG TPA: acetylglutamate kinase [Acidimicrobiia bacterium]|nr:acetylglutamate kinase [Acidimicrobiia bacterium]